MQLDACPVCNEPAEKVRLRHDHTPRGGGVPPACTGIYGRSDVLEVMLTRSFPVEAGPQVAASPEAI